ncbi:hypothetical protein FPQ18DRAFT_396616 [Pyronema domesticum]|nr:hypothetical protein FPQ18DRAFT_396616 [Pyronema domesticum]
MSNERDTMYDAILKKIDELQRQLDSLKEWESSQVSTPQRAAPEAQSSPVRSSTHDAPAPESSQVAAIQRAGPAAKSPQVLTDQVGAREPITGSSKLLSLSGPQDQLLNARQDQECRIVAANKTVQQLNSVIEFRLTSNRNDPFDFNRKFSSYNSSELYKWTNEVQQIINEVVPIEDWSINDATHRLKLIYINKRLNYRHRTRGALPGPNSPSRLKEENNAASSPQPLPQAQVAQPPSHVVVAPVPGAANIQHTPILRPVASAITTAAITDSSSAAEARAPTVHCMPITYPRGRHVVTGQAAAIAGVDAVKEEPINAPPAPAEDVTTKEAT